MQHEQHHDDDKGHSHGHAGEEHGHGGEESIIVKKLAPNEVLASSLSAHGVITEPVAAGTHPLESKEYYSHKFGFNSKFTTNRGMIRVRGRNFDLVQVLQRN